MFSLSVQALLTSKTLRRVTTNGTRTYIEEHDVSVREVGLKGGAVVVDIGSVGGDGAALVGRAVRRGRGLSRTQTTRLYHVSSRFTQDKQHTDSNLSTLVQTNKISLYIY